MLSFTSEQNSAVAATTITPIWCIDCASVLCSTQPGYSYDGDSYDNAIDPATFNGITLSRAKSEHGILAPSMLSFSIVDPDGTLSGFTGASTSLGYEYDDTDVYLIINDVLIAQWTFKTTNITSVYFRKQITCKDLFSYYLDGDWPNTPLVSSLSEANDNTENKGTRCVPVPFGTCYAPLKSVYIDADEERYYVLGSSAYTYTISEIATPREFDNARTRYSSGSYTFTQATKTINGTSYRVFQPEIYDEDMDGTVDAAGHFSINGKIVDCLTEFYRSDTQTITNPADVIEAVLLSMDVPAALIDSTSFSAAESTYSGWGLTFEGAFTDRKSKHEIVAQLLNACNSTLIVTDKFELHVFDADEVSLTGGDSGKLNYELVVGKQKGKGSFKLSFSKDPTIDSGYVAYCPSGEPQDELRKVIVSAINSTGNTENTANETLELPFVSNSQHAKRAAQLHYIRKYFVRKTGSFTGNHNMLRVQPNDVIKVLDDFYGEFRAMIDSTKINKNGTVDIVFSVYDDANGFNMLENWGDATPTADTINNDETTIYIEAKNREYQYSSDGSTWSDTITEGDTYLRQRPVGSLTWSPAFGGASTLPGQYNIFQYVSGNINGGDYYNGEALEFTTHYEPAPNTVCFVNSDSEEIVILLPQQSEHTLTAGDRLLVMDISENAYEYGITVVTVQTTLENRRWADCTTTTDGGAMEFIWTGIPYYGWVQIGYGRETVSGDLWDGWDTFFGESLTVNYWKINTTFTWDGTNDEWDFNSPGGGSLIAFTSEAQGAEYPDWTTDYWPTKIRITWTGAAWGESGTMDFSLADGDDNTIAWEDNPTSPTVLDITYAGSETINQIYALEAHYFNGSITNIEFYTGGEI